MNQAFHLYRLQQIDTQIDQIDSRVAELDLLLSNDEQVVSAQKALDKATQALEKARKALKTAEVSVRDQNLKIEQTENTLYSGKVRNPKELQDLQKEIVSLKKHLGTLEDQQLEKMLAQEEAEENEDQARSTYLEIQAKFTEKSSGWVGEREQLLRNRDRLLAERAPAVSPVPPDEQAEYDRMRLRKKGIAVTSVKDGACAICGATIRPAEIQNARASQDLAYCSTCGRILYTG